MKIYCIVFGCLLTIVLIGFLWVLLSSGNSVECLCEKLRVYKPTKPFLYLDLPIIYINLERSKARDKAMKAQLSQLTVPWQRLDATDGKVLDKKSFKCECTDTSLSEIACTLSHFRAIERAYSQGLEMVVVLEDDASLEMTFLNEKSLSRFVEEDLPKDWEILQLTTTDFGSSSKLLKGKPFVKRHNGMRKYSTIAYLINRKGMKEVLDTYWDVDLNKWNLKRPSYGHRACVADVLVYFPCVTYILKRPTILPLGEEAKTTIGNSNQRRIRRLKNVLKLNLNWTIENL